MTVNILPFAKVMIAQLVIGATLTGCLSSGSDSKTQHPAPNVATENEVDPGTEVGVADETGVSDEAEAEDVDHISTAPAFVSKGTIRGISISAPIDDWHAASYGMNDRRLDAMREAGFNTHRAWMNLADFLDPPSSLDETISQWIEYIERSLDEGFRVKVSWGSSWQERIDIVNDPKVSAAFDEAVLATCTAFDATFSPQMVALEIVNEPAFEQLTPSYYSDAAPRWFRICRDVAPDLTLMFQPEMGWHNEIGKFDLADFDENTIFSFHPYAPGEFTHQGIGEQPHLYNVPMPITNYAGGKQQMLDDVVERVNNDSSLSEDQKKREIVRYSSILDYLWAHDGTHWEDWTDLEAWVKRSGINPKRIMAGEFGVVSEHNFNGVAALTDVTSRANFLRKVVSQTEANGFAGWSAHQAFGDFNLFQQYSVGSHKDELIPELVAALFGDKQATATKPLGD